MPSLFNGTDGAPPGCCSQEESLKQLEMLFTKYHLRLVSYLWKECGNESDANDIACKTYKKLAEQWYRMPRSEKDARSFLFGSARGYLRNHCRKYWTRLKYFYEACSVEEQELLMACGYHEKTPAALAERGEGPDFESMDTVAYAQHLCQSMPEREQVIIYNTVRYGSVSRMREAHPEVSEYTAYKVWRKFKAHYMKR